ncbi:DUF6668 family protein [Arthrobacter sp. ISL-28]|uniref:DUF6668 family protein n=1 Tax=Arthrobacter sp. ISL-28 TaxID=2819108 RepID=UPI001BE7CF27|nr:DUF6668 family protein [Arthrobacter sp. ISL-28]MBT2520896.1 hypothetical protein [Arthrobacter sp. ISL-28]
MNQQTNPWVEDVISESIPLSLPEPAQAAPPATGVTAPSPGVPEPGSTDRLPRRAVTGTSPLWIIGTHGGAGETRLTELIPSARTPGHAWPVSEEEAGLPPLVLLVCRSDRRGLTTAQNALIEWASGTSPRVELLGMAIMADAPGKLPKPLKEFASIVGSGAPRHWLLPWVEEWRYDSSYPPGREYQRFLTDISALIN